MRRLTFIGVLAIAPSCSDDGVPAAESSGGEAGGSTTGSVTTTTTTLTTDDPATGLDASADSGAGSEAGESDTTAGGNMPMGTAGCGMPVTPGMTPVTIDVDGTEREYILVVPEGYDGTTPLPLVFAWHGLGGDGAGARVYFGVEQSAANQAIFIYPYGLPLESMGGMTGWDLSPEGYDVAFFDAMLTVTSDALCVDPARVFSTGHSFGGYISNALGCFRASELRAIGPVAGGPAFGTCQTDERVAAIVIHGSLDEVVLVEQGEMSRDALLERNGCAGTSMPHASEPCVVYDGCMDGYPVWWCEHDIPDFSGHTWPGFAADAIWGFFAALPPE